MTPPRGRQRRQDRRTVRRGGTPPTRYRMREKLLTFGDDYYIENASGGRAFKVDGKALRLRNTIQFLDLAGRPLYRIQERVVRIKDTMVIEQQGKTVATVQKALVTPLRNRLDVTVAGEPPLRVQGNILDHEYTITREGERVASVSKRWFRVRDTYGVEVMPGEDDAFVLAVAAAVDAI